MGLYEKNDVQKRDLILTKQIFPYEFVTSVQRLASKKGIPDKKYFYSTLTDSTITDEEYNHAVTVYNTFNCDSMLSYAILYCELDCAGLGEILWAFREETFSSFGK